MPAWELAGLIGLGLLGVAMLGRTPRRASRGLQARWVGASSRFIDLDDMHVHLRDEGPQDDPLPLVLLHGSSSDLATWDGWVERLPDRRVIRLDRPGFGLTGPHPVSGMAASVDFVLGLLDNMGVKRFMVAGSGSGGKLAWHLALRSPARVAALVLLAPGGKRQHQEEDAPIRTITAPTLIMAGTRDASVAPTDAARFHADIAGSELVMLPGVGHLVQEEAPDETVAAFLAFERERAPWRGFTSSRL